MEEMRETSNNRFLYAYVFAIILWNNIHLSEESQLIANCSNSSLVSVPKNLPVGTKVLDLSKNKIAALQLSDFTSLSNLRVLNLSHNLITDLDLGVFQLNEALEYLDLSYNILGTLSCHPIPGLRHLDLSYNNYTTMPICQEFGNRTLKYLGLSAKIIHKSDFNALTHLQLHTVFLGLQDLSVYEPKGLSGLNTKNLCIVLPNTTSLHFLSDLTLNVTESLDLSNIQREQVNDLTTLLSKLNKNSALLTLTLTNLTVTWRNFIIILQTVWHTPIEYFSIYSFKQVESIGKEQFNYEGTSLKALAIKEVTITEYYFNQNDVYSIFSEMNIKALTVSDAQLFYMLCPSKPSLFSYLCFSNNQLTDTVFKDCQNLLLLETLILQKNRFRMLSIVSSMTGNMKSLKYLDMSRNLLQYEEENGDKCQWADTLVKLNLSSNKLTNSVFRCLPKNTQMLDLQNNGITSVPKEITELKALEELNIAFNRLRDLPGCSRFTSLGLLNIEMNSILSPSSDFFHSCPNIRGLKAGHNPFECSCELRDFIRFEKQGGGQLIGWPESYVCEYPDGMKGTFLKDFHLSEVSCNTTLLLVIALVTIVVVMALVSFLCIFFDVLWYLKMMWQWTQAKRRVWDNHTEDLETVFEFHAFISYSERDSLWVKNVLIPNLEKEDGSVRICLHERNFIPGKTIVENIINCIEKSYKSIFVLSPNFVQSEWCHYELYFAHHKVFSENTDSLILILLESIPQYIIPARYHKLKALMAKRTYLEWPKEKGKHRLFWANLRAAINAKL